MKVFGYTTGPIMVNTYLAYDENKLGFIVDPGGPSKLLMDKINKENINLKYIVLTHGHADHIGGIADLLSAFPQLKIIACEKEEELLMDGSLNSSIEMFRKTIEISADIWVKDGDTIEVGNMTLKFIETPGHTKGGMCIQVEDVLFSGDTLFRASIGRTDFYGGNYGQLISSIKDKLFILDDKTKVLPGHEEETSIEYEKKHNPFVR